MSSSKTRVVVSWGDPGKWLAQYYDAPMKLWFDIGDAQADRAQAQARADGYRRPEPLSTRDDHRARPDDDPEPGDRCKECGEAITWAGPSTVTDWEHVR
jgi:hypothetical protein